MKTCRRCGLAKPLNEFNKNTSNCRKCTKTQWRKWRSEPVNVVRTLVNNARRRAIKQRVPFALNFKDLTMPDVCPVLGIKFDWTEITTPNSPSLDRLNPNEGYVPGNVVIISHMANRIKSNATPNQIRAVADWVDEIIVMRDPTYSPGESWPCKE